jgi:ankyrin repeat protein
VLVLLFSTISILLSLASMAGELSEAVKSRDLIKVRRLLEAGADANEQARRDCAINVAATMGPIEMVTLLLDAGADIECVGRNGFHPLHNAAFSGHADIVAQLIKRGAKVDSKDTKGRTPLISYAASAGSDLRIAKILLAAGADPQLEDTVEHQNSLQFAAINGDVDLGKTLVEAHADINGRDGGYWGDTVLGLATYYHRKKFVEWLLAIGADVNLTNKQGKTPLQRTRAERLRDLEVEQVLVDVGGK